MTDFCRERLKTDLGQVVKPTKLKAKVTSEINKLVYNRIMSSAGLPEIKQKFSMNIKKNT